MASAVVHDEIIERGKRTFRPLGWQGSDIVPSPQAVVTFFVFVQYFFLGMFYLVVWGFDAKPRRIKPLEGVISVRSSTTVIKIVFNEWLFQKFA